MRMRSTSNIFAARAPRQMPSCVTQKLFCEIFCELHLPSRSQKMRFRCQFLLHSLSSFGFSAALSPVTSTFQAYNVFSCLPRQRINLMPDIPWYFYTEVKHSQLVPMEMLVEKRKEFLTVVYLVFEQRSTTVPGSKHRDLIV